MFVSGRPYGYSRNLGITPIVGAIALPILGGWLQSSDPDKDKQRAARIDLALQRALADPDKRWSDFGTDLPCSPCTGPEYLQYMTTGGASAYARAYAVEALRQYQLATAGGTGGGLELPGLSPAQSSTLSKVALTAGVGLGVLWLLSPAPRGRR